MPWGPRESKPRLRVLCLHGRRQTSAVFEHKLDNFISKAASFAEFAFVDGPAELELADEERVNTRGWSERGNGDKETAEHWTKTREVLLKAWAELGPFDGVLGFSEGASAALLYCLLAAGLSPQDSNPCEGLRFAVFAGGTGNSQLLAEVAGHKGNVAPLNFPSYHTASAGDTLVPIADSRKLAKLFRDVHFHEHDGGHSFPQRAEDIRDVVSFLEAQQNAAYPSGASELPLCPMDEGGEEDVRINDDQKDELQVLASMPPEDGIVRLSPAWPVRLQVPVTGMAGATLIFVLPPTYPQDASCRFDLYVDDPSLLAHRAELMAAVNEAREPLGFPSILSMIQAAHEWAEQHATLISTPLGYAKTALEQEVEEEAVQDAWWEREEDEEVDEAALSEATEKAASLISEDMSPGASGLSWARECGASAYGKPWDFVVGLVGKPSAGKSTFFNAVTRPDCADREAAMASHPFTTIDPNVGPGWFAAPCPTQTHDLGVEAQPAHGTAAGGRRRHPLLVKDVAGLVPGAYLGRGRGNAFLNDLCDADSLVHIVDASGRSDQEGVDQSGGGTTSAAASDPFEEVRWVRREIHLWIFCNVRAKWFSVRKRAKVATLAMRDQVCDRLFGLFVGYHATKQLVSHVYEAAGFSLPDIIDVVKGFREYDLHLLVACFLRVRFPIVIALNKMDMPESSERVAAVRAKLANSCVPVSAWAEWWLWDQQRQGHLTYVEGAGGDKVQLLPQAPVAVKEKWKDINSKVMKPFGTTGVLEALSQAVLRRRPIFAYPVTEFSSLAGLQRMEVSKGNSTRPAPLSTMIMLRPLTTVEEVYSALKHEKMLRGDFVRAEMLEEKASAGTGAAALATRVIHRDEVLRKGSRTKADVFILRVLTNKKNQLSQGAATAAK